MKLSKSLEEHRRLLRQYERIRVLMACGVSLDTAIVTVQKGEL